MLKFSLKFLRPHYFLTLSTISFIFGLIIHICPKYLRSTIHTTLGHVKVKVLDLEFSCYFFMSLESHYMNYMVDLIPIWYHDRYWSKHFISTVSTHDRDLEVDVTDLEFKC